MSNKQVLTTILITSLVVVISIVALYTAYTIYIGRMCPAPKAVPVVSAPVPTVEVTASPSAKPSTSPVPFRRTTPVSTGSSTIKSPTPTK